MKTNALGWGLAAWRFLTEVPGWPDAPRGMRLRRAMPLVVPCVAIIGLLAWKVMVDDVRVRAQHVALQPLLELEAELTTLKSVSSDQQFAEVAERAAQASQLLLDTPDDLPKILRALKQAAAERGWEASFVASDPESTGPVDGAVVGYLPVRGKLVPLADNRDVFGSFMAFLDRFSAPGKRIDLIRLAVRADEQKWQGVELNFRLAYLLPR